MFAGPSHLTFALKDFRAQVPRTVTALLPLDTDQVVLASGVVEIGLGAAIAVVPQPRRELVGNGAMAFFVAVLPGNIAQLIQHRDAFGLDTDRKRALRLLGKSPGVGWPASAYCVTMATRGLLSWVHREVTWWLLTPHSATSSAGRGSRGGS